jgi:hypothetical protein
MFFASRVLLGATKLSAITSKRGNKNFYKGRGAKSLGYKGTKGDRNSDTATISALVNSLLRLSPSLLPLHVGRFTFDPSKFVRVSFIAPDVTDFPVSRQSRSCC